MTQHNRRDFLKTLGLAGVATAGMSLAPNLLPARSAFAQMNGMAGKVVITLVGGLRIHTYIATDSEVNVTSHIVETENSLIMVDTQLAEAGANELAAYIEAAGKPLERIYLSHAHPDHYSGSQVFDAPFMTTDAIAAQVAEAVEGGSSFFGTARIPDGGVVAGTEDIDGVTFEFTVYNDAEALEQIVVKLPDAGVAIVQDLVYNNVHSFPLGNNPGWLNALEVLQTSVSDGYNTLLPGHGVPTTLGEIDAEIAYLQALIAGIESSSSADELTATMTEQFPNYSGAWLLSFSSALFGEA